MRVDEDVLWIFFHLHKTGGTTFNEHLYWNLRWDEEFVHFGPWGRKYREKHNRPPFEERPPEERHKARVLGGHHARYGLCRLVPDKTARYITFVRDPADRIASWYNFQMSRPTMKVFMSFDEWYETRNRNEMVRYLGGRLAGEEEVSLEKAVRVLDLCWFVGLTERLNEDLPFLFGRIGVPVTWKNYRVAGGAGHSIEDTSCGDGPIVVKKFLVLDEETRQFLYDQNPLDVELYAYARQLYPAGLERLRGSLAEPAARPGTDGRGEYTHSTQHRGHEEQAS